MKTNKKMVLKSTKSSASIPDSPEKFAYANAVTAVVNNWMKTEDSIKLALERGRALGLTDMQVGDDIRAEGEAAGWSRATITRYLPPTAKHKPRGNPQGRISKKTLLNEPVAISTESKTVPASNTTISTTKLEQQEGRPGITNQSPKDFDPKEIQDYDTGYLSDVALYFYAETTRLKGQLNKWGEANERLVQENIRLKKEVARLKQKSFSSSPTSESELKPYEPPKGKDALDVWELARMYDDNKTSHCRLCKEKAEAEPNMKQDPNRMFEHKYKRYKKTGWIEEIVQVYDNGKLDLYHITGGCMGINGDMPPYGKYETKELELRQKYWKTHSAPMDKIDQARQRQKEYDDEMSKLTPEEKQALTKYQVDQMISSLKGSRKK